MSIPPSNLITGGGAPWHHPGSSPSSLSSGGSVSPPGVDPSPSKAGITGIISEFYIFNTIFNTIFTSITQSGKQII